MTRSLCRPTVPPATTPHPRGAVARRTRPPRRPPQSLVRSLGPTRPTARWLGGEARRVRQPVARLRPAPTTLLHPYALAHPPWTLRDTAEASRPHAVSVATESMHISATFRVSRPRRARRADTPAPQRSYVTAGLIGFARRCRPHTLARTPRLYAVGDDVQLASPPCGKPVVAYDVADAFQAASLRHQRVDRGAMSYPGTYYNAASTGRACCGRQNGCRQTTAAYFK
jgi:hypothetical protein